MKSFLSFCLVLVFSLLLNNTVKAQPSSQNVVIMTNFERTFPDDGSRRELDSLAQINIDNMFKNNEYVVSYKIVSHYWGHDSRDFIEILELKNFSDIPKAYAKANDLMMKAMPDKSERDNFYKAYNKYFTGKHSDEIYSEVTSND